MTGVEEVLSQINAAIDDWSVSEDAMRCNAPVNTIPSLPLPELTLAGPSDEMLKLVGQVLHYDDGRGFHDEFNITNVIPDDDGFSWSVQLERR